MLGNQNRRIYICLTFFFLCWIYTDVVENGWTVDTASQMVTVKKQAVKREQKVDSSKLQRLTEYVFHLEH